MNAIELLKNDHKKMRKLLADLESTTARGVKKRTELLNTIHKELSIHARIEEEIFYPAFKAEGETHADDKLYFEALEEHRAAEDLVLPDLMGTDPATEKFSGRAKVLKELIEHHAKEEEKTMFPRARKLLSAAQLRELGAAMEVMKDNLSPGPALKPGVAETMVRNMVSVFEVRDDDSSRTSRTRAPSKARKSPAKKAKA